MPPAEIKIRPARAQEAAALTDLVMRSKAAWGYDSAMMESFRDELTVTPERVAAFGIQVAEAGGRPVGLYGLSVAAESVEVELLFIDPAAMRQGIGRRLWTHLRETAEGLGARRILITADPEAEGFYRTMGAHPIGTVPSLKTPGRVLPRLEYSLAGS